MQIGIWAVLMIIMLVTEAATQSLVSIWFAAGALSALLAAVLGASLSIQTAVFFFVSGILLAFLLPFAKRKIETVKTATNADRIIGKTGVVTQAIDPTEGKGQIRILGSIWSAKTADGSILAEGTEVIVEDISGVKAVVRPQGQ